MELFQIYVKISEEYSATTKNCTCKNLKMKFMIVSDDSDTYASVHRGSGVDAKEA